MYLSTDHGFYDVRSYREGGRAVITTGPHDICVGDVVAPDGMALFRVYRVHAESIEAKSTGR